jgi:hypothetical protein
MEQYHHGPFAWDTSIIIHWVFQYHPGSLGEEVISYSFAKDNHFHALLLLKGKNFIFRWVGQ